MRPALWASYNTRQQAPVLRIRKLAYARLASFPRRIVSSGCSHYEVFISGRKAMYFGRDGEFYTEPFLQAK